MTAVDVLHQQSGPTIAWSRVNMAESVVGVQTPASWSIWDEGSERGFRLGYRALGLLSRADLEIPESVDQQFTGVFYGQGACNINTFMSALAAMPGSGSAAEEAFFASSSGTRHASRSRRMFVRCWLPVVAVSLPLRLRRLRRRSDAFWRATTASGALDAPGAARERVAEALHRFGPAVGMQILASTFITIFYGSLKKLLAELDREDLELKLIGGYGSMSEIKVTADLWRISRGSGELAAFLTEHGFHGPNEGELSDPSWREDPRPIVVIVEKVASMSDDADPGAAERRAAAQRRAAEREVVDSLSRWRRARAWVLLALSRRYIPMRVEAKTAFMQVFDAARAAVRAEGRRLAAAGVLADPDDVFYLTVDELLGAPPADARETVAERRATRERYLRVELPLEWVGMPEPLTRLGAASPRDGDSITALGVSSGTVEGRARVLLDAADPDELQPGEVLVCHTTDPSWSSYFFVAAAVVIDIGGTLSHGAIVARELGIPCVVNTQTGTQTIRSGDRVRVDGDAGTVEILQRGSEETQ